MPESPIGPMLGPPRGPPLGPPAFRFQKARTADASYLLTGVTRDNTGAILGGCTVDLFYSTGDKQRYGSTVSDPTTGGYSFTSGDNVSTFFCVFYKSGGSDVAGTTKNNLTFT